MVGGAEQLVSTFELTQHLVGSDGTGHFVITLAAGGGTQQVIQLHTLGVAEIADSRARPRRGASRQVASLRARGIAQIWMPDAAELIARQVIEERPRGYRHLALLRALAGTAPGLHGAADSDVCEIPRA